MGISNYSERLSYIYQLIDKDGIFIDNYLYSKKYKRKIDICGHYHYFKKIDYSNNPDEKSLLIDNMLNLYSDDGEVDKNSHICKVCGEFLMTNKYDETEGFSESGMIKKSRETWIAEKVVIEKEDIDLFDFLRNSDLEDKNFKELLLNYGLSVDDIEQAVETSIFIVKNLYSKVGIKLSNTDLINIIIDSMQKIKNIVPYTIHRIKKIKQLQEKGFSKINIEKIDEKGTFKNDYERYYMIKKNAIIISRFLISIQTSVPSLTRSSKLSVCPFNSFDGDEGITFMACILNEMNIILLKDKTKSIEIFKTAINESYNEFKNIKHIRELFSIKNNYDKDRREKVSDFLFENTKNADDQYIEVNSKELSDDKIKKSKNIEEIYKYKKVLYDQLISYAKNIKKTIKDIIRKSSSENMYQGIERSSCTEDLTTFIDYYFYIETDSEYPIKKDIDQSNTIFKYYDYFINEGSIHNFLLYDKNMTNGIHNSFIVDNEKNSSEKLIKAVFEVYVDTGIYAGTLREYTGSIINPIDIKTGLTKNEILSKTYTIESYQTLLKNIEKYHIKYNNEVKTEFFKKDQINSLKKSSEDLLDKEIHKLINNISIILNKDKKFVDHYIQTLRNLGIFNQMKNIEEMNTKERIKYTDNINKNKLKYIKNFYITKFKKYLSIIKNSDDKLMEDKKNIKLDFTGSDKISLEIQEDIFKENEKLKTFFDESVKKYFMDLDVKYTNEEINSINGMDNIYDSKYEKIKVYSDFNFNDASNVILYIFISQLNRYILCISNNDAESENNDINILNQKNNRCKHICNFIMILLEEIDDDNELLNLCNGGVEKIKNSLIHQIIEEKSKQFKKEDDNYFISTLARILKNNRGVNDLDEKVESDQIELTEELNKEEKMDYILKEGKKKLTEKYGYEPTDAELETYKENYLENMENNGEEDKYDDTAKGEDVIDQGAGYGELNEYDFENGDGFDYSAEEKEFYE